MTLPTVAGVLLAALVSAESAPSPTPADIPRLIEEMKASYAAADRSVAYAFGQIGAPAVPALIEVLTDRTLPHVDTVGQPARCQAALALTEIGRPAGEAVPALLRILGDGSESDRLRRDAAGALGAIGARPRDVVPALLAVLDERNVVNTDLGHAAADALWRLARYHPDSRPALVQALPALRKVHQRQGGSHTYAEMFRILEPPSAARVAQEDAVQEILIRKALAKASDTWCLHQSVSDAAFERLNDLKVTRSLDECRAAPSETASATDAVPARHQELLVRAIDWLSETRVYAETEACFGYDPCSLTQYKMERRGGRWLVVSEDTLPAM